MDAPASTGHRWQKRDSRAGNHRGRVGTNNDGEPEMIGEKDGKSSKERGITSNDSGQQAAMLDVFV